MKRLAALLLLLLTLTACAVPAPEPEDTAVFAPIPVTERPAALGLAVSGHLLRSMHATEDFSGYAQLEAAVAAVLVDSDGVIRRCRIDGVRARIPFDCTGALGEVPARFPSKTTLRRSYGMHKASPAGTEWYQQAEALARSCIGKRAADLRGGGDTVTSVTIDTGDLLQAVIAAAESARPTQGLSTTDELTLTCCALPAPSRSAGADSCGRASFRLFAVARADTAQSSAALAAHVPFDGSGHILCDLAAAPRTGSPTLYPTGVTAAEWAILQELAGEN